MNPSRAFVICVSLSAMFLNYGCKRQYLSKATFELKAPNADAIIQDTLPKGDSSVVLKKIRDTDLYQVEVYSTDPEVAAKRANELVINIRDSLKANGKSVKIWEIAEPALKPAW